MSKIIKFKDNDHGIEVSDEKAEKLKDLGLADIVSEEAVTEVIQDSEEGPTVDPIPVDEIKPEIILEDPTKIPEETVDPDGPVDPEDPVEPVDPTKEEFIDDSGKNEWDKDKILRENIRRSIRNKLVAGTPLTRSEALFLVK